LGEGQRPEPRLGRALEGETHHACGLEVLDENAVLTVLRTSDTTINEEQCRDSVRDLAKKFYAAVQP
jgi:hypothetical protein